MPPPYGYLEPHDLSLSRLPDRLVGCRIAHLSDIHAWRPTHRWTRLAHQLSGLRLDLVLMTGDYAYQRKREDLAFSALKQLTDHLRPSIGIFGVFGNHDHAALRQMARDLPVHWLTNQILKLDKGPIELFGLDAAKEPAEDAVAMLAQHEGELEAVAAATTTKAGTTGASRGTAQTAISAVPTAPCSLRICLSHYPDHLMTAADLGCDLMFCGHTHGGQCRLPTGHPLYNCSGLPLSTTSGILRHRRLLVAISRGCGSGPMPPRVFCPPHVPVYTLRRGPMNGRDTDGLDNLHPW